MYHAATSRGAETSSSNAPCASNMEGEWNMLTGAYDGVYM